MDINITKDIIIIGKIIFSFLVTIAVCALAIYIVEKTGF